MLFARTVMTGFVKETIHSGQISKIGRFFIFQKHGNPILSSIVYSGFWFSVFDEGCKHVKTGEHAWTSELPEIKIW